MEGTVPNTDIASLDHPTSGPMDGAAVRALIEDQLDQDQAEDVAVIDLAGKSNLADCIIVASGRSGRHVASMAEKLRDRLKGAGIQTPEPEGLPAADWVVLDAGDVIVHLFRPEVRAFYNLEKLWGWQPPGTRTVAAVG